MERKKRCANMERNAEKSTKNAVIITSVSMEKDVLRQQRIVSLSMKMKKMKKPKDSTTTASVDNSVPFPGNGP